MIFLRSSQHRVHRYPDNYAERGEHPTPPDYHNNRYKSGHSPNNPWPIGTPESHQDNVTNDNNHQPVLIQHIETWGDQVTKPSVTAHSSIEGRGHPPYHDTLSHAAPRTDEWGNTPRRTYPPARDEWGNAHQCTLPRNVFRTCIILPTTTSFLGCTDGTAKLNTAIVRFT